MDPESKNVNPDMSYPSFSIVIHWYAFHHSESWRPRKMLELLAKQIISVSKNILVKPEIIIVYIAEETRNQVKDFVIENLAACQSLIDLKVIPAFGLNRYNLRYYALKNFGATHASHEVIIFIDNDVIPDKDWLTGYLEMMENPETRFVAGDARIRTISIVEKAFSLFWLFPTKEERDDDSEKRYYHGNNFAIRQSLLNKIPFPKMASYHGQGPAHADTLRNQGIKLYFQPKSRVEHPAPTEFFEFISKAMCWGHDLYMDKKLGHKVNLISDPNFNLNNRRSIRKFFLRIKHRHRYTGLNPITTIGSLCIITGFIGFIFIGYLLSSVYPSLIRNHLST